jgi:D-glycero-alpha-D-manno-heptose-7-phosphate kinase
VIITRTPLRISLFGGGTDIPAFHQEVDGAVFAVAINKYVWVCLNDKFGGGIRVSYSITENVDRISQIKNELIRETLVHEGIKHTDGLEIVTISDVPSNGSGLGSSSALCVGLIAAIRAKRGEKIQQACIANAACDTEINLMGKPIGKQDQYTCALGGVSLHTFGRDSVSTNQLTVYHALSLWGKLRPYLLLLHVGARSNYSADTILAQAQAVNPDPMLVDAMAAQARLMHTLAMTASESYLHDNFGQMLRQAWEYKKQLTPLATNDMIDGLYNTALSLGAEGAKILGAGGAGFMLVYAPPEYHKNIAEGLGLRVVPFELDFHGVQVIGG